MPTTGPPLRATPRISYPPTPLNLVTVFLMASSMGNTWLNGQYAIRSTMNTGSKAWISTLSGDAA